MKITLDRNVLLDYVQKREPHYAHSSIVVSEVLKKSAKGVIPAHATTTLYYLVSKHAGRRKADEFTDWLLAQFEIAPASKSSLTNARSLDFEDFEDAVVANLAHAANCDFIVTRNVADFQNSPVPAITPEEEEYVRRFVTVDSESSEPHSSE